MAKHQQQPQNQQPQNQQQPAAATFSEIEPVAPPPVTQPTPTPATNPAVTPGYEPPPAPVVASTPAVAPVAAPGEFTRCFEVKHDYRGTSYYGAMRVLADTPEEAVAAFCRVKCPEADAETRKHLVTREIEFRPASTEAGKPGGWRRGQKIKSRDGM